jgi:hypothetical protein
MESIFEDYGIIVSKKDNHYYMTYDEGEIVMKDVTIEISCEDAEKAQLSSRSAYEVIIKYQNLARKK